VRLHVPAVQPQDVVDLPFWLGPTSYWQPARFVTTAWVTHAPFAFWLTDVLRPRSIVELGSHFGFSCFVFAEAAKRLGIELDLRALDSWEGDDQAGFYGDEVYESVRKAADEDYPGIVRLLRGYFADLRPLVADDSADLLHIDGRHGYEDVLEDYTSWRSTVRDGGIILFHDIAEHQAGFGVWRLWDEIAQEHPTFAFAHGHGLGVAAVGEVSDPRLRELFDADEPTAARIRTDYERLGEAVAARARLEQAGQDLAGAQAALLAYHDEIERLRGIERENRELIDAMQTSTSWGITAPLRAMGRLRRRD
jgi:hypothetical protein